MAQWISVLLGVACLALAGSSMAQPEAEGTEGKPGSAKPNTEAKPKAEAKPKTKAKPGTEPKTAAAEAGQEAKPGTKDSKQANPRLSKEDAIIIKHLEFFMLFEMLQDYDLFADEEAEPSED